MVGRKPFRRGNVRGLLPPPEQAGERSEALAVRNEDGHDGDTRGHSEAGLHNQQGEKTPSYTSDCSALNF